MTEIDKQPRTEWYDAVFRICKRDTGRTPSEWFEELSDGDEHRQRMHLDWVRTLSVAYQRGTSPESFVSWCVDHLGFREEEMQ